MTGWQEHFNFENRMVSAFILELLKALSNLSDPFEQVSDATPAFLLLILMSLVPVDLRQFKDDRKTNHRFRQKKFEYLLNWNNVIRKLPWNVILLFGGGLALAEATQVRPKTLRRSNNQKTQKSFSLLPEIRTVEPANAAAGQNEHQMAKTVHCGSDHILCLFHRDRVQFGGDRGFVAGGEPGGTCSQDQSTVFSSSHDRKRIFRFHAALRIALCEFRREFLFALDQLLRRLSFQNAIVYEHLEVDILNGVRTMKHLNSFSDSAHLEFLRSPASTRRNHELDLWNYRISSGDHLRSVGLQF